MGPLGGQEIFLIFIVILLLFGAKKLPELARGMGRSLGEFKKAKDEFEREIMTADQDAYHGQSEPSSKPVSAPDVKPVEVKKEEEIASVEDTQEHSEEAEPSSKPEAEASA